MVKSKRPIDDVDTYESDGGFVSNDDGKVASSDKKSKKAKTTSQGKGADGNAFWSVCLPSLLLCLTITNYCYSFLVVDNHAG